MLEGNLLLTLAQAKNNVTNSAKKFSWSNLFSPKKISIKVDGSFELVIGRGLNT